jgi:hypothetical protein
LIKVLKLSTGEELIGEVVSEDPTMDIKNPCIMQLIPSRSDPTKASMGMFPYAQYYKGSVIEISTDHIVYMGDPVEDLYNQYNSIFGSGIQIASGLKM